MPTPKRQKVNYTLTEALLPEIMSTDRAGEFFVAKAEQTVWFVASNGALVSLTDLLQNAKPVAPPRHGRDGNHGLSIKGERGERGSDGKDGVNGKDGRDAVGVNGNHGTNGHDGKDGAPGSDSAAVLAETRIELANVLAKFEDLRLVVEAIHGQNKQCDEYLQHLREKRKAKAQ